MRWAFLSFLVHGLLLGAVFLAKPKEIPKASERVIQVAIVRDGNIETPAKAEVSMKTAFENGGFSPRSERESETRRVLEKKPPKKQPPEKNIVTQKIAKKDTEKKPVKVKETLEIKEKLEKPPPKPSPKKPLEEKPVAKASVKRPVKPSIKPPVTPSAKQHQKPAKPAPVGPTRKAQYKLGSYKNPKPRYPKTAQRRGWQGRVLVTVKVGKNGKPKSVSLAKSSGHKVLDDAALTTIRRWSFDPAMKNGKTIVGTLQIPIRFQLK